MNATLEIVPSVLDRIRKTLVGLKMPRALEVLDQTVRQLERGESSALEVIDTLFAEELTLRENRRVKMALRMAKLSTIAGTLCVRIRHRGWQRCFCPHPGSWLTPSAARGPFHSAP